MSNAQERIVDNLNLEDLLVDVCLNLIAIVWKALDLLFVTYI